MSLNGRDVFSRSTCRREQVSAIFIVRGWRDCYNRASRAVNAELAGSARNFGPRPAVSMEVSPLIVDGVMYTTAGANRDVVAIDAGTGQQLWHWRPTGDLTRWFDIIDPLSRTSDAYGVKLPLDNSRLNR